MITVKGIQQDVHHLVGLPVIIPDTTINLSTERK